MLDALSLFFSVKGLTKPRNLSLGDQVDPQRVLQLQTQIIHKCTPGKEHLLGGYLCKNVGQVEKGLKQSYGCCITP